MKTLATFFVTLLLLAGSAWAQTHTIPATGTSVETMPVTAKVSSSNGDIWDEVIVNAADGQYGYVLNVNKLQRPGNVTHVEACVAAGREAVRQGIARGFNAVGSVVSVWTSDNAYVMRFQTGNGIVLVSFEGGGGIQ